MTKREEREDKLKKFLLNNSISFEGEGSCINYTYTVISGYALFIGVKNVMDIIKLVNSIYSDNDIINKDFAKVFKFAKNNCYGDWWEDEDAKQLYTF